MRSLGEVPFCTLTDAKQIEVEGRKYCAVNMGVKTQSQAIATCKNLNARLPLPKSEVESSSFLKMFPDRTWLDITNPVFEHIKVNKMSWKDSTGKVPEFVKIRVTHD